MWSRFIVSVYTVKSLPRAPFRLPLQSPPLNPILWADGCTGLFLQPDRPRTLPWRRTKSASLFFNVFASSQDPPPTAARKFHSRRRLTESPTPPMRTPFSDPVLHKTPHPSSFPDDFSRHPTAIATQRKHEPAAPRFFIAGPNFFP